MQKFFQTLFTILERLSPRLGSKLAFKLFFTPLRAPNRPVDTAFREKAEHWSVEVHGKQTNVYRWGAGKVIVLAHGWGSKALHYRRYIEQIVDAGFSVVAPDMPAHGTSKGKTTSALEFRDTLTHIAAKYGPIHGLVGHSLGAMACVLMLMENNHKVERFVVMNSSTTALNIVLRFQSQTHAGPKTIERFYDRTSTYLKQDFRSMNVSRFYQSIAAKPALLVVADNQDPEVPLIEAKELAIAGGGELYITHGLQHTGSMKDEATIKRIVDFIQGDE